MNMLINFNLWLLYKPSIAPLFSFIFHNLFLLLLNDFSFSLLVFSSTCSMYGRKLVATAYHHAISTIAVIIQLPDSGLHPYQNQSFVAAASTLPLLLALLRRIPSSQFDDLLQPPAEPHRDLHGYRRKATDHSKGIRAGVQVYCHLAGCLTIFHHTRRSQQLALSKSHSSIT